MLVRWGLTKYDQVDDEHADAVLVAERQFVLAAVLPLRLADVQRRQVLDGVDLEASRVG